MFFTEDAPKRGELSVFFTKVTLKNIAFVYHLLMAKMRKVRVDVKTPLILPLPLVLEVG